MFLLFLAVIQPSLVLIAHISIVFMCDNPVLESRFPDQTAPFFGWISTLRIGPAEKFNRLFDPAPVYSNRRSQMRRIKFHA